jgi:hypothetical protein
VLEDIEEELPLFQERSGTKPAAPFSLERLRQGVIRADRTSAARMTKICGKGE